MLTSAAQLNHTTETNERPLSDAEFSAHLECASRIVATWPKWKREVLGWVLVPEVDQCT